MLFRSFELLEREVDSILQSKDFVGPSQELVLRRAVDATVTELEPNLWEDELERLLDFGHTFSPSLEMNSDLLHGEAVAIDMVLSAIIAYRRGLMDRSAVARLLALLTRAGLPTSHKLCIADFLWAALNETTKHRDGMQRCPLPVGIGRAVFVNDLSYGELEAACLELRTLLYAVVTEWASDDRRTAGTHGASYDRPSRS